MVTGLQPYPAYRDSGVSWLGRIPESWELRRAKYVFRQVKRPTRPEDEVITCFRDGSVTLRRNRRLEGFTESLQESGYQGIRVGDLVIHQMDAFAGAVGVSDSDGKGSPAYAVCVPIADTDPRYQQWVVRHMAWSGWIAALATGIRERSTDFRFQTFARQFLPLPSAGEQQAIVDFLGSLTGKIDRLIRAKGQLLARMEEEQRATIHHAIAGAGDVERKRFASTEVPAHWELRKLWTLGRLRRERNPGDLQLLSVFLDRGVIRYSEGGGQVHAPSQDLSAYQVVRPGDLVLNNQQAWRGSVGVAGEAGIISPAYLVVELSPEMDRAYAGYLMRSAHMVSQFVTASRGVGDIQRQLYWPYLRNALVPVPPLGEQREIAARLTASIAKSAEAMTALRRQIGLLKEYRMQAISDVVTGKLDVRGAARSALDREQDALGGDLQEVGAA